MYKATKHVFVGQLLIKYCHYSFKSAVIIWL